MTRSPSVKPTHKPVKAYYAELAKYAAQDVAHEGAVRTAFQNLLDQTGSRHGWTLIPEFGVTSSGKTVIPDGKFRARQKLSGARFAFSATLSRNLLCAKPVVL